MGPHSQIFSVAAKLPWGDHQVVSSDGLSNFGGNTTVCVVEKGQDYVLRPELVFLRVLMIYRFLHMNIGSQAAEGAVQEEMEAASVAQATQNALTNALTDLTNMEIRFQENAERSIQERTRARISAKVDACSVLTSDSAIIFFV